MVAESGRKDNVVSGERTQREKLRIKAGRRA